MSESLQGQTAVVTGSSSGIGQAIALEFARAGADVLVHARRNESGAQETVGEIRKLGREADFLLADLADPESQDRFLSAAWSWRDIDIWLTMPGPTC